LYRFKKSINKRRHYGEILNHKIAEINIKIDQEKISSYACWDANTKLASGGDFVGNTR